MPAQNELPISRFPVPELDALPEDIRSRILKVQEKSGFIPNVFLALAHRPGWRRLRCRLRQWPRSPECRRNPV